MGNASFQTEEELDRFVAGKIDPAAFPHAEHLRLGYEMLARHPFAEAVSYFSRGLRKLAAKSGHPQLYHDTITVAFLALVGERRAQSSCPDWKSFIAENKDLLDKRCLERWYDPIQLQSDRARQSFILPAPMRSTFRHRLRSRERASEFNDAISLRAMMRVMTAYLITYASSIIGASLLTLWKSGPDTFLKCLASTEVVGAVLFLFGKTRFAGTVLLLLVFTVAMVAEIASGGLPIRFFIYGASALLIWVMMGWLKTARK